MSSTALHLTPAAPAARVPVLARVAAAVAVPLGLMNVAGAVIFWEWSWLTWVAVVAAVMGAATLAGAVGTLLGRAGAQALLRRAMAAQLGFTLLKLVGWQEGAALVFGGVALVLYLMVRER